MVELRRLARGSVLALGLWRARGDFTRETFLRYRVGLRRKTGLSLVRGLSAAPFLILAKAQYLNCNRVVASILPKAFQGGHVHGRDRFF